MGDDSSGFNLHAWVDESMIVNVDDGLYILAAVACDPTGCDSTRDHLRSLRDKRQPRLHWQSEVGPRRAKIAAAVSQVDMAAVVVIGTRMQSTKQERARRTCMETLLPYLAEMGVAQVWLESRMEKEDQRDR